MDKINKLIKGWPKGSVMLSSELKNMGYPKDLLQKYLKSGWLESLGYGAFIFAGDKLEWYGAISALQKQKKSNIHPAGKTALIMRGYAHYLGKELQHVYLFGGKADIPPRWFNNNDWRVPINYIETKLFNYYSTEFYSNIIYNNIDLQISSPELASMEMLYLIPKEQSFDEAIKIMEGLTTLRANLVQKLLEECNSIKVKRLFLFMSESLNLPWVRELDLKDLNLGSGKRSIVKEGVLDKKYNITVPQEYAR